MNAIAAATIEVEATENRKRRDLISKLCDPNLPSEVQADKDPRRVDDTHGRQVSIFKGGRNTDSFDPNSTLVRPSMRIHVAMPNAENRYKGKQLTHDDVCIVPNFFCDESDTSVYYKLIEEMKDSQLRGDKNQEWISWHEGCHLISKGPEGSPTFHAILKKCLNFFNLKEGSQGTRFNWYRDGTDWKAFHHDSAAFNPQRARATKI